MQRRLTDEEVLPAVLVLAKELADQPGLNPLERATLKRWRAGFTRLGNPALNRFVEDFKAALQQRPGGADATPAQPLPPAAPRTTQ
jgi:hypothetical protein